MLDMDLGVLGLSPLLVGLKQGEIEALLSLALKEGYAPGEVVVEEGTPGDTMYMVKSGGVTVHKTEKQGKERVRKKKAARTGPFGLPKPTKWMMENL